MSKLILYTNTMSRGNTVELFLKILNVPYQRVELEYGESMRTPEYLAINPMAKVPALVDGENVVTETGLRFVLIWQINLLKKDLRLHLIHLSVLLIIVGSFLPPVLLNPHLQ